MSTATAWKQLIEEPPAKRAIRKRYREFFDSFRAKMTQEEITAWLAEEDREYARSADGTSAGLFGLRESLDGEASWCMLA
jgi:hypothetical protein